MIGIELERARTFMANEHTGYHSATDAPNTNTINLQRLFWCVDETGF